MCEQSRTGESEVQVINLGVSRIQVVLESVREKGSSEDPREEHVWRRAEGKGQKFGEGP